MQPNKLETLKSPFRNVQAHFENTIPGAFEDICPLLILKWPQIIYISKTELYFNLS